MPTPDKAASKARFMEFLMSKNLRVTSQRQAIIDTVFATDQHFNAEQLLVWSRKRDRSSHAKGSAIRPKAK